jgi:hypothetical protein
MTFINKGANITYFNNNLINKTSWDLNYNGERLNIDALVDKDQYFISLNSKEIEKILHELTFQQDRKQYTNLKSRLTILNKPKKTTKKKQTKKKQTKKKQTKKKQTKKYKYKCIRLK